jgi:hypothetical protein
MLDRPGEFGAHFTAPPENLRNHEDQEYSVIGTPLSGGEAFPDRHQNG